MGVLFCCVCVVCFALRASIVSWKCVLHCVSLIVFGFFLVLGCLQFCADVSKDVCCVCVCFHVSWSMNVRVCVYSFGCVLACVNMVWVGCESVRSIWLGLGLGFVVALGLDMRTYVWYAPQGGRASVHSIMPKPCMEPFSRLVVNILNSIPDSYLNWQVMICWTLWIFATTTKSTARTWIAIVFSIVSDVLESVSQDQKTQTRRVLAVGRIMTC